MLNAMSGKVIFPGVIRFNDVMSDINVLFKSGEKKFEILLPYTLLTMIIILVFITFEIKIKYI